MVWEPRPLPIPTNETYNYWKAATKGKLMLNQCNECNFIYHYPRALCPKCFSDDVDWIESSGKGTIYTYTVARQTQFSDWPEAETPIVMVIVELTEGPKVPSIIKGIDTDSVEIGMPVKADFIESQQGDIAIPVFTAST